MGAPGTKTIGGGRARMTGDAFNQFLLQGLNSGQFGQSALGQGLGSMIGQGFSPLTFGQQNFDTSVDMSNPQFAAMNQMLQRNTQMGQADLRSRYGAAGGAPRGSAAAFAEGNFLAQANPANTLAMGELANSIRGQNRADLALSAQDVSNRMNLAGNMQGNALQMLMNSLNQANQLGTPAAQTVQTPSAFGQTMGAISSLAPYALAPFTGGASLGMAGMFKNPFGGGGGGTFFPPSAINPGAGGGFSGYGAGQFGLGTPQYRGFNR